MTLGHLAAVVWIGAATLLTDPRFSDPWTHEMSGHKPVRH
jgi:hypothetical protein